MTDPQEKLTIELSLLLPSVADARDACVERLVASLSSQPGIDKVHVKGEDSDSPELCMHYDPARVSIQRVRQLATAAGAELTQRYGHMVLQHEPMHARAARLLSERLRAVPGVLEAEVAATGAARIEFDRTVARDAVVTRSVSELGLRPVGPATTASAKRVDGKARPRSSPSSEEMETDHADHRHADGHEAHGHDGHDHKEHAHEGHAHKDGDHKDHEHGEGEHKHSHGGLFGENTELIFALLSGALVLVGWLLSRQGLISEKAATAIFIGGYFFGGFYTVREALENIRARRFEIDTLMLVAAAGAAALGQWMEGALLLFLFSLGHSLEHYAMGRAKRAIEALAKLAPETASVRRGDQVVDVAVAELEIGDAVLVKPNERLPADGVVIVGTSSVNQAPVTGESVPVDKQPVADPEAALRAFDRVPPQHRVFAGTINGSGALEIKVAKKSGESTMARVVKLVTEAQAQRSPTQNFTDKFEKVFVPAVLVLVLVLLCAGLVIDEPFSATFYRAMAVLVAASPCALAISVPSAVLSGIARAARSGVLVKGGGPLENLGTLKSIAFDKTGTLTEGKPKMTDVVPSSESNEEELLEVVLAVERHSDHPLATAIVQGAEERLQGRQRTVTVDGVRSITGRGIEARADGKPVHVGKAKLFDEIEGKPIPEDVTRENDRLIEEGRTTMLVRLGDRYLGIIGVMDTPRPAAPKVMESLKALGIQRLIMISGDNQRVADAVAKSVGLTEAKGDLMPDDKVEAIKALRAEEGGVAMVGDGVNDAPAMANATVGIAMGAAGSDVALETADVALMADDLEQLPLAVGLSRATSRIIKQNLWVSLGVVVMLIPATIFGLKIGIAVLFHEGSTLIVVANALRLLAYSHRA